jgi:hypothetical protein
MPFVSMSRGAAIETWSENGSHRSAPFTHTLWKGPPRFPRGPTVPRPQNSRQDETEQEVYCSDPPQGMPSQVNMPNDSTLSVLPPRANAALVHTVNHVVFGCSRYTAARSGSPRFDLDFQTGRPIKRLCGLLRDGDRTGALLCFLEATNACFRSRSLRDPGSTWHPFLFFHISERESLGGLGLNPPGSRCLHFPVIPFRHSVPRASHCSPVVSHFVCSPKLE